MESLIRNIIKKYNGVEKAVLVGSRAKGNAHSNSDYDIILFGDVEEFDKLKEEISEGIPFKVDLLMEKYISIEVLKEMLIGSRIIYKRIEEKSLEQLYHKFLNFQNAFIKYETGIRNNEKIDDEMKEIYRDAIIKRYEFTYEMYYKTLNALLKYNGEKVMGSKDCFRKFCEQFEGVGDIEISIDMVNSRNNTTHSYSLEMSVMEFKKITEIYYKEIKSGYEFLKEYVGEQVGNSK